MKSNSWLACQYKREYSTANLPTSGCEYFLKLIIMPFKWTILGLMAAVFVLCCLVMIVSFFYGWYLIFIGNFLPGLKALGEELFQASILTFCLTNFLVIYLLLFWLFLRFKIAKLFKKIVVVKCPIKLTWED
jgi:hypothetical protein